MKTVGQPCRAERVRFPSDLRSLMIGTPGLVAKLPVLVLLKRLGLTELNEATRRTVAEQLAQNGLVAKPDLMEVTVQDVVELGPAGEDERSSREQSTVGIRHLSPAFLFGGEVARTWVVSSPLSEPSAVVQDIAQATGEASLSVEVVADLLAPDDRPKAEVSHHDNESWLVQAFALSAPDSAEEAPFLQPLEMLVTRRCLILCRHPSRALAPASAHAPGSWSIDELISPLRMRRPDIPSDASPALMAACLLTQTAITHQPAIEAVLDRVDRCESSVHRDGSSSGHDEELGALQRWIAGLRGWLGAEESVVQALEEEWPAQYCSPAEEVALRRELRRVTRRVSASLRSVERLDDRVRALYGVLEARHARDAYLAVEERRTEDDLRRKRDEEFQDRLTVLGALFIVPTFVAGIFGMNVGLPFERAHHGFIAVLVVMALCTAIALSLLFVLRRTRRPIEASATRQPVNERPVDATPE